MVAVASPDVEPHVVALAVLPWVVVAEIVVDSLDVVDSQNDSVDSLQSVDFENVADFERFERFEHFAVDSYSLEIVLQSSDWCPYFECCSHSEIESDDYSEKQMHPKEETVDSPA